MLSVEMWRKLIAARGEINAALATLESPAAAPKKDEDDE